MNKMRITTLLNFAILIFKTSSLEKNVVRNPESKISNEKYSIDFETDEATTRQIFSDALLSENTVAKLSDSLRVHPAKIWKLKHRFKSGQDLGIDESKLNEFINYRDSERLVGKLHKALKGEDVHLTVIGGSNSGGAGVQEDEGGAQGIFPLVITDWWAKAITPQTGSELILNLVSIGGTGSDFHQYCHHAYVENNLDLVLLEMSVNDLNIQQPLNVNRSLTLEQLTRQLLLYPSQPALIYVNLYSGMNDLSSCKNLDDYGQRSLSHAYKITSVRWRDLVCPLTVGNVRKPLIGVDVLCKDTHHINLLAHAQVSLMLINVIREVLLKIIPNKGPASSLVPSLPKPVFIKTANKIISNPLCWTTITPNYQNTAIKNNLEIKVVENTMFKYWPLIRMGYPCEPPRVCRTDAFSGWVGTTVGARVIVSFTIPDVVPGDMVNTRSVVFATRTCSYCGKARVWIDNDFENGKIINAKRWQAQTSANIIALHVNPGVHTLTISVLESANVTLAGVMLGPPDGPY